MSDMRFSSRLMSRIPSRRARLALYSLVLLAGIAFACGSTSNEPGTIHVLTANSDVNPVMEGYIDRGIDAAEDAGAKAVVIRLDTPGGLVTSMESIVQRIQAAEVPVIVYVAPSGGKAASAGTFITMSAPVAAMAPGTSIGAAHPVAAGGGEIEGPLGDKVENNAAAYARSVAEERDRNADWAERAVRESISASTSEAVELNVVDFAADNLEDLLRQAEGRTVKVAAQQVTLEGLPDAPIVENDMTFLERLLLLLADPNIAFILLSLGGLGLLLELLNPGLLFPGVAGVISLVLAFFALGTMPVNWAGVALILFAFVLFAAEIFIAGFGVLGVGGIVSLIAGGILLTAGTDPALEVSRWLLVGVAAVAAVLVFLIGAAILKTRRMPAVIGERAIVGSHALARSDLDPEGFVMLRGERWRAIAEDAPIGSGESVEVVGIDGLELRVRRAAM